MRCGQAVGVILASLPALALAQSTGITPGMWEVAVTIDSVDAPGAPPIVARMMRGKTTRVKHCITPEEAGRGPQALLKSAKSCTFTRYDLKAGHLTSEMVCSSGGQTTRMSSTGTFTPGGFTSRGRAVSSGAMPMTVVSHSTGRLLGPCK